MPTPGEMTYQSRRSRIVINIDDPKQKATKGQNGYEQPRRKKSRVGKVLGIFAGLLLLLIVSVVAGGYLWWQSYKQKPAYSLALVVDAVQRNDTKTFDSLVDTDKVVENLIPQLTDKASAQYASALPATVRRQVESMMPRLMPAAKQRVHDTVAQEVKDLSSRAQGLPFILVAVGMPWMVGINQTGDNARVSLKLNDRPIELAMQRNGERWRVMGLKDDQLAQKILETAGREIPSTGPPVDNNSKDNRKRTGTGQQIQMPQITLPNANR